MSHTGLLGLTSFSWPPCLRFRARTSTTEAIPKSLISVTPDISRRNFLLPSANIFFTSSFKVVSPTGISPLISRMVTPRVSRISIFKTASSSLRNTRGGDARMRHDTLDERFDHGAEDHQAISGAQCRFHGAFGMGHQPGDIALAVADSGDIADRAVGIAGVIVGAIRRRVTKDDLTIFLEGRERGFVAIVVAVAMRDGNLEDLALLRGVGERRVRLFHADVDMSADETQAAVAHHSARKQAGFEQNLKAIADPKNHAAVPGKLPDRFHHRRKACDGSGAQIIAVREAARQNDGVAIREVLRLVPDKFDGLFQDVPEGIKRVVVAIGPGEDDDSKFHVVVTPWGISELLF